ncbi:MAG: ATP-dependent helicase/nuclease subunit [Thermosediminibacterales bacterium]|nr:ATP-dependent helicase/nuclease subunit [Thermosediminibacterales bacterium]MDK2835282.1 ATP-dependent helicase/nuclease subunit [Thermosediminibacterales bacterium]
MALRFILGRAGTGKTRYCLEQIIKELKTSADGPRLIFLVPEQATFQSEIALVSSPEIKGIMRAEVLSFRRLAYRVLQEVGGLSRTHIGELGKRMLLYRFLEKRKNELRVFGWAAKQVGFADNLSNLITELKTYKIAPIDLDEAMAWLDKDNSHAKLFNKLNDLKLIYNDFEEYLSSKYIDPDDYLNLLAEKLGDSLTFSGAKVWIDGFTGFTPQELNVLESLMKVSDCINITLCLDSKCIDNPLNELDVFYKTRDTMEKILKIAEKTKTSVDKPLVLDDGIPHRFRKMPDIAHLEKEFFNRPATVFKEKPTGVKIIAAANRRAEVEAAAREIIRLSRDEGYRWRDISVLLRDLESYSSLIARVFNDYDVPCFIDEKRKVLQHPLIELVRSAVEVAIQNWAYDPVFRFLKTDLTGIKRDKIDILENYVLAHGIKGSKWFDESPWAYKYSHVFAEEDKLVADETNELEVINKTRAEIVLLLGEFYKKVIEFSTVRDITTALFELLVSIGVPERLKNWSDEAREKGDYETALIHKQVWDGIVEVFDQIVEALGDEDLSLEEYLQILDAGLKSLKLGIVPLGLDQVIVGSLDRSRSPNVRAVFILGVSDGVFPMRMVDEGIFTDREREFLSQIGLELAPDSRRKLFDEQYFIYTALTRASQMLWLSYPLADEEGKAIMPSSVIRRVKELLPALEEISVEMVSESSEDDIKLISTPERTMSYMAYRIREAKEGKVISPIWWDVYNWFVSREEWRDVCQRVLGALFMINQESRISSKFIKRIYGNTLRTSVSQLEKFMACPFSHFLYRGLRLKERKIYKLSAPDMGRFFHAAMDSIGKRIRDSSLDWGDLSKEQCNKIVSEVVEELAPKLQNEILMSTARYRYLIKKIKRILARAVYILSIHAKRGGFRPVGFEISFGEGGKLSPLKIRLADGSYLEIVGRIDRIDAAESEDIAFLRVIDYKSGNASFKLSDVYHGLSLQLLTYLDVALTHAPQIIKGKAKPGGMLYFRIDDPVISSTAPLTPEEIEKHILKKLKMKGLVLAHKDAVKLMDGEISGYSELIPVGMNKNGEFYSSSSIATYEQFEYLRKHLRNLIQKIGQDILEGKVKIEPYQKGKFRACQYCPYRMVCQFDVLLKENIYRFIKDENIDIIWTVLQDEKGGA